MSDKEFKKVQIQNLMERYPSKTEAEVRRALRKADGKAGPAGLLLDEKDSPPATPSPQRAQAPVDTPTRQPQSRNTPPTAGIRSKGEALVIGKAYQSPQTAPRQSRRKVHELKHWSMKALEQEPMGDLLI